MADRVGAVDLAEALEAPGMQEELPGSVVEPVVAVDVPSATSVVL